VAKGLNVYTKKQTHSKINFRDLIDFLGIELMEELLQEVELGQQIQDTIECHITQQLQERSHFVFGLGYIQGRPRVRTMQA
jgi:hypothetical protein